MEKSSHSYYSGLEVVNTGANNGLQLPYGQELKEVIQEPSSAYLGDRKLPTWSPGTASPYSSEKEFVYSQALWPKPKKSRKQLWMLLAAIASVAVIIAIVVPIGVVISRQHKSTPNRASDTNSTTPSAPASTQSATSTPSHTNAPLIPLQRTPSTKGAFNGTGLTSIPPLQGTDRQWLFWQDYTGDLKVSKMDASGSWKDAESLGVQNAANGTALASLTHFTGANGETVINHLVYTTSDNYLADVLVYNATGDWQDGGLYKANFKSSGPFDGQHPSRLAFMATPSSTAYLYAPASLGNFNEIAFDIEKKTWTESFRFQNSNGFGGIAPQLATDSNLTTLHMLSKGNKLRMMWRQANVSPTWYHGADDSGANVYPNSSITAPVEGADTNLVYYQNEKAEITASRIAGIQAKAQWKERTGLGIMAMPGTSLFAMALSVPVATGNWHTEFFWQKDGDDIQHYSGTKYSFQDAGAVPLA